MNREEESHEEQMRVSSLRLSQSVARRNFLAKSLLVGVGVMGLDLLEGYSPVSAAATTAQEQLSPTAITAASQRSALTPQLHICNRATNGQIYHTIRYPNGTWSPKFSNVNNQESNGSRLRFTSADCAGISSDLHVTALATSGVIWHTIRYANGSWQSSYANVNNQEGNGGSLRFNNVGCAGTVSNKLQLVAVGTDGNIWHTIRYADGSWQSSYGNVNDQEGNGGSLGFGCADCAIMGEDLHVCGVDKSGVIWHTIRYADGSWQSSYANVNNQESNGSSLRFNNVGCASIGGNLHLTAVGTDGNIWHTIRNANGSWQSSYGNVNGQESNGGSLSFIDVDCANVGDILHVTAIDGKDIDWHTIRYADGSWQSSYGNINNQEGNGGSLRFTSVSAGGIV